MLCSLGRSTAIFHHFWFSTRCGCKQFVLLKRNLTKLTHCLPYILVFNTFEEVDLFSKLTSMFGASLQWDLLAVYFFSKQFLLVKEHEHKSQFNNPNSKSIVLNIFKTKYNAFVSHIKSKNLLLYIKTFNRVLKLLLWMNYWMVRHYGILRMLTFIGWALSFRPLLHCIQHWHVCCSRVELH